MRIRIVTYNIHKGIGGIDRLYRPQRTIDTLQALSPDIILMQEVDDGVPRSKYHRQVDLIADALGMPHRAYQCNVHLKQGGYGNAIVARYPLHDVHNLDLSVRLKKRRRAQFVRCSIREEHQQSFHLVNCHLGLAGFERSIQLRKIVSADVLRRSRSPVIIGGDFNDVWGSLGGRIMEPAGFQATVKTAKTFPAVMPVRSLDKIFLRGNVRLIHGFVGHAELARHASDHLPVVADLEFTETD